MSETETALGLDAAIGIEEPIVETPEENIPETPEPELPEEQPEETEEAPAEGAEEAPEPEPRAETLPSQVTKLARELSKERPEIANTLKHMRDAVFTKAEYEKTFGNIDAARNLKATIEAIGGEEGLAELQSAADDLRTLDQRVAAGDPKVVEAMFSETPEGAAKITVAALEKLAQVNPQAYENAIRPPLVRVLNNVSERLEEAAYWIQQNQPDFARQQLSNVVKWIKDQGEATPKQGAPATDPRLSGIEERESRVQEAEERSFVAQVGRDAVPYVRNLVFESLKPQIAALKLTPQAKDALFRDIMSEFDRLDDTSMSRWRGLVRSRDAARAISYVKARADASAARIAREVFQTRYGSLASRPANGNTTAPRANGAKRMASGSGTGAGTEKNPLRIPQKPPDSEIDRNVPNWQMLLITGRARTKSGGKWVTWK